MTLYAVLQDRKSKGIVPHEAELHIDSVLQSITSHIMNALEKQAPTIQIPSKSKQEVKGSSHLEAFKDWERMQAQKILQPYPSMFVSGSNPFLKDDDEIY
jgi:hypothetical protein